VVCVLLDGPVTFNGRVQRTVTTLSRLGPVVLVTAGGTERDQELFGEGVEVRTTSRPAPSGLRKFVLLHRQNDGLIEAALAGDPKFDVVWANDYSTLHPGLEIARATGAKLVYDSHELWIETVNQFFPAATGAAWPKRLAFRAIIAAARALGNRTEPRLAAGADVIVAANPSYAAVLSERFGRNVGVILNTPQLVSLTPSDRIRREMDIPPEQRIVLYQGVMNAGRGLPELVASARDFPDDARLVLLGHGVLEASLRDAVRNGGLQDRVTFGGSVPQSELHEWTASADLGVLVLDPINLSKRLSLANKIFEYMAAAIPVLTTDLPENRRIIEECECGWLVPGGDPAELATAIGRILADPDEMARRGRNGRHWFEERYNWEIESRQVLETVGALVPAQAGASR
jgi:glycosyltransferase involved in cell wall biosynthesis